MAGQEWIRVEIGQIGVTWSSDRGQHARCHIAGKLCLAWVPPEAWIELPTSCPKTILQLALLHHGVTKHKDKGLRMPIFRLTLPS